MRPTLTTVAILVLSVHPATAVSTIKIATFNAKSDPETDVEKIAGQLEELTRDNGIDAWVLQEVDSWQSVVRFRDAADEGGAGRWRYTVSRFSPGPDDTPDLLPHAIAGRVEPGGENPRSGCRLRGAGRARILGPPAGDDHVDNSVDFWVTQRLRAGGPGGTYVGHLRTAARGAHHGGARGRAGVLGGSGMIICISFCSNSISSYHVSYALQFAGARADKTK